MPLVVRDQWVGWVWTQLFPPETLGPDPAYGFPTSAVSGCHWSYSTSVSSAFVQGATRWSSTTSGTQHARASSDLRDRQPVLARLRRTREALREARAIGRSHGLRTLENVSERDGQAAGFVDEARSGTAGDAEGWSAGRAGARQRRRERVEGDFRLYEADALDDRHRFGVDRHLRLGQEVADRAIVEAVVTGSEGVSGLVGVRSAGNGGRVISNPGQTVKARSAQHHRRMNCDQRGDQELASGPQHGNRQVSLFPDGSIFLIELRLAVISSSRNSEFS